MPLEPSDSRAGFALPIAGTARVRLFPLAFQAAGQDHIVVRRDTGRMLKTSPAGVEAIRLLRRGLTLDAVRGVVGRANGCDPAAVDLSPLLDSLVAADFVAAIDGRKLALRQPSFRDRARATLATSIQAPLMSAMIRRAPLGMMLRALLGRRPGRDTGLAPRIAENMRRTPALVARGPEVEALSRSNCASLRRYYVERLLLALLPPHRLDRWVRKMSSVAGTHHLDAALAEGHGVLLCASHVTSYSMVPWVLAARGYAQTVLMLAGDEAARQLRQRLGELRQAGYDYPMDVAGVGFGMRALVRTLRRGGTVLLLFDATVAPGQEHLDMPFLGATLRVAKGAGWLAWRTGARVLPVSVQSQPGGRCHVVIHPALAAEGRASEPDCVTHVLRRLTAVLEHDVQARPEQWLKWKDHQPGESSCDT